MTKVEMRGPVVTMQTLKTSRVEVWLRGPEAVPVHALAIAVKELLPGGGISGTDVDVDTDDEGEPTGEVRLGWSVVIGADGSTSALETIRRVRALNEHLERHVLPTAVAQFAAHHAAITGHRPE